MFLLPVHGAIVSCRGSIATRRSRPAEGGSARLRPGRPGRRRLHRNSRARAAAKPATGRVGAGGADQEVAVAAAPPVLPPGAARLKPLRDRGKPGREQQGEDCRVDEGLADVGLYQPQEVQRAAHAGCVHQTVQPSPSQRPEPAHHGVGRRRGQRDQHQKRREARGDVEAIRDVLDDVRRIERRVEHDVGREMERPGRRMRTAPPCGADGRATSSP